MLRPTDSGTTRLDERLLIRKSVIAGIVVGLFLRRKLLRELTDAHNALNDYCTDLVRSGRTHPNRIVLSA